MLFQSIQSFKVPQEKVDIRFFSPSFNDSCVIVYIHSNKSLYLAHVGKQGEMLSERPLDKSCKSFRMITDQSIVFFQMKIDSITVINFKNQTVSNLHHEFAFRESDSKRLEYFSENNLLCIEQEGDYANQILKLTYYSLPINQLTKSIAVYESKQGQWQFGNKLKKGDNRNMIIWFNHTQMNMFQFHTFHLRDQQGSHNVYKIDDPSFIFLESSRKLALYDVWKINYQQFLAACTSPLTFSSQNRHEILHVTNSSVKVLTDTLAIPKGFYIIQRINLGEYTMLSFSFTEKDKIKPSKAIFHIDHEKLSTIKIHYDDESNSNTASLQLDFDHSTYMALSSKQQKDNSQIWSIKFTKIINLRQIALHFMLYINEDFDDDLLQDGLELLDLI